MSNGTSMSRRRRASMAPGREVRPKSVTVDVHSHVGVPRAAEFVKPHLDCANHAAGALRQRRDQGAEPEAGGRHRAPRASLDKRLADLDAMGLDMQVIKPPPPQCYYAVPLEIAVKAARDGQRRHRRVRRPQARTGSKASARVPMPDGNEAAKELERCVTPARLQGRAGADQRQRQGAVRPRLRAVLEEGRGAGRAGRHPPQRLHRTPSGCRASTSTTSSAIRWRRPSPCTT